MIYQAIYILLIISFSLGVLYSFRLISTAYKKWNYLLLLISLRLIIGIIIYLFLETNLNPGGDGERFRYYAKAISEGTYNIQEVFQFWKNDLRYLPYIYVNSTLEFIGGPMLVSIFQTYVHIFATVLLFLTLKKVDSISENTIKIIVSIFLFLPLLLYYSHIYLRDIYLVLGSSWFLFSIKDDKISKVDLLFSMLIFFLFKFEYTFFFGMIILIKIIFQQGISKKSSLYIITGLIIFTIYFLSEASYILNQDRLVPYLQSSGRIALDDTTLYSDIDATQYLSFIDFLKTAIGIFGPYHMFHGQENFFIEYRNNYSERIFEGINGIISIIVILSLTLSFKLRKYYDNIQKLLPSIIILLLFIIILTFTGYNRWKLVILPQIYYMIAFTPISPSKLTLSAAIVLIAMLISLFL